MRKHRELLARLTALDDRIDRLEGRIAGLADAERLRAELQAKQEQLDALARQALAVVEMLADARRRLASSERGEPA